MVRLSEADRWYVVLIWLALVSFGADWAGLHFMVGAFLAGAVLDSEWFGHSRLDALRHHVLLVLMPVFFLFGLLVGYSLPQAIGRSGEGRDAKIAEASAAIARLVRS